MLKTQNGDPLKAVSEQHLHIEDRMVDALTTLRRSNRFTALPGDSADQAARLELLSNDLIDSLIAGLTQNPSKLWVMTQFQKVLEQARSEDTEGREHFGEHLEQIMDILNIQSSDGLLMHYLF